MEIEEAVPGNDGGTRETVFEADDGGSLGVNTMANMRRPSFKGGESNNLRRPSFKMGHSGMGLSSLTTSSAGGNGNGSAGAPHQASIGESTRLSGLRPEEERRVRKMTVIRHAAQMSKTKVSAGKAPMRLDANEPVWLPRE